MKGVARVTRISRCLSRCISRCGRVATALEVGKSEIPLKHATTRKTTTRKTTRK